MTKQEGWKALVRLLGPTAYYEDHKRASSAESRADADQQWPTLQEAERVAKEARDARYREILANDAEYQRLTAELKTARDAREKCGWARMSYRLEAGTFNGLFYTVHAHGDNWADLIRNVKAKQATP